MSKSPLLPKEIYVAWEESGDEDDPRFLLAAKNFGELARLNEERQVGVYQLVRATSLFNESELKR